jgi:hypothetical protein
MIGMLTQQLEQLQETLDKRVLDIEGKKAVAQINAYGRIMQQMAENGGRIDEVTLKHLNELRLLEAEQAHERSTTRARNLHEFRTSLMQSVTQNEIARQKGRDGGAKTTR